MGDANYLFKGHDGIQESKEWHRNLLMGNTYVKMPSYKTEEQASVGT